MTIGELAKQGFDVNGEILKIWQKYPEITKGSIFPLQYPDDMELSNDILVIGLNPSWSGDGVFDILLKKREELLKQFTIGPVKAILESLKDNLTTKNYESPENSKQSKEQVKSIKAQKIDDFFRWNDTNDQNQEKLRLMKWLVDYGHRTNDHYRIHHRISKYVYRRSKNWTGIDLFAIHKTDWKNVTETLRKGEKGVAFRKAQLELSLGLVRHIFKKRPPRIILTCYREVDKELRDPITRELCSNQGLLSPGNTDKDVNFDDRCVMLPEYGYDTFSLDDVKVPIILTSNWNDGHLGTRNLAWHVFRVLKDIDATKTV